MKARALRRKKRIREEEEERKEGEKEKKSKVYKLFVYLVWKSTYVWKSCLEHLLCDVWNLYV